MAEEKVEKGEVLEKILIKPFNQRELAIPIVGTAPLVINRFGKKAIEKMIADQMKGDAEKRRERRKLPPKDFTALFKDAQHVSRQGWQGFPANGLRAAMVRACKVVGLVMTDAKLAFVVKADGYDRVDGTPLVRITKGDPEMHIAPARNDNGGIDIRSRAMFAEGWEALVRVKYDGDLYDASSIVNLLERVGQQVGLCEGRPFSKDSCGMGWGTFTTLLESKPRMVG